MPLIPVVLEFSGVTKDSSVNLTLTADGVNWSIGGDSVRDSEGFSYNRLVLGDTRPACLTDIELTESVLAIRTSPNATGTSFSLSLFIDVQPEVESVLGHCTLNAGASVVCYLGYEIGVEWRSGPFSAIVPRMSKDVRRVQFDIQNAPVGSPITIDLLTERSEGEAHWCFDSGVSGNSGLILKGAAGAPLPLQTFAITERKIIVTPGGSQKIASHIFVEVYLRRAIAKATEEFVLKKLERFHLRAACDPTAAVVVRVGAQQPQYVAATYSCLYF